MMLPWKTASQSLVIRLAHLDQSPYSKFFSFNTHLNRVVHQHLTCADYLNLPEAKLDYFLASFVRNPYDRVYSGFRQIQADIVAQPYLHYDKVWV
ncbi:sulfotransferase family 2 domain-containing protein [Polynucleobacter asymbioticus]|uniref:sulfotransferase family 2 domain-containing protein n=1 Tax=Polynucleobacter asymbioticus TaxID=576611 RepID=UPI0018FFD855|nr:sulfotransferase family 2 domain-containing protein [Polynucleobacter asymbioticus]